MASMEQEIIDDINKSIDKLSSRLDVFCSEINRYPDTKHKVAFLRRWFITKRRVDNMVREREIWESVRGERYGQRDKGVTS